MSKHNLIGIHMESISTDMNTFAENGRYKAAVQVLYKINDEKVQCFQINRPIEIFHKSMLYKDFESIVRSDTGSAEFMSIPGKAYRQMQYYINKEVEKVLADMVTAVIAKILKSMDQEDTNIFFIDSRESNKIYGRLGYMYLNNIRNTFCFVSYKTDSLITDTLRNGSETLELDIDYFMRYKSRDVSEIVPNDFMESLLQTVFYKMAANGQELPPLRCDIFSQGITNREIQNKVEAVREVMSDSDKMSLPFEYIASSKKFVMLPKILYDCIEAVEHFSGSLQLVLEDNKYDTDW